jgi:hypothetical protein
VARHGVDRTGWDKEAIGRLNDRTIVYEKMLAEKLDKISRVDKPRGSLRVVGKPVVEGKPVEDYKSFDAWIVADTPEKRSYLARVELEVGMTQEDWTRVIPDRNWWHHGLNVLLRKSEKDWEIYVKSCKPYPLDEHDNLLDCSEIRSFFAFRAAWFEKHVQAGRITLKDLEKTSLDFVTCTKVFSIPWDLVDSSSKEDLVVDDWGALRDMIRAVARPRWEEIKAKKSTAPSLAV